MCWFAPAYGEVQGVAYKIKSSPATAFAYFAAFPLLGRNYDAAVLCAGMCGFGLGATPNAMANMSAVCYKYRHTVKPFLIVPIIGAMFADLINTGMITFFLNILK